MDDVDDVDAVAALLVLLELARIGTPMVPEATADGALVWHFRPCQPESEVEHG